MSVLIVVESMYGNTRAVADALAQGMRGELEDGGRPRDVVVLDVAQAPARIGPDVELLLLGGPTHAFSMSRESTRKDALTVAGASGSAARGMREWIDAAEGNPTLRVITFDTRVKVRFIPGSAARSAAEALQEHCFGRAERGETFWVQDKAGPLRPGELERAAAWGAELADKL